MSQTNFRKVILATLIILIIAVVAYFFIAITATEKQPLPSNAPEQGSRPLASTTTNSSPEISLLSNKSEYTLGDLRKCSLFVSTEKSGFRMEII